MVSDGGSDGAEAATAVDGRLLRDVVTGVVLEVAPEERPLLRALSGLDDATVVQRLTARGRRDEPLAFGVEVVTAMVTPVVWIAVDEAVRKIVDSAALRADTARCGIRGWFGRGGRSPEPVVVPPLTRDQVALVERSVLDAACGAGLSQERATRIADGVVRRLVLAPPPGGPADPPDTQGQ
jgi:hypothetical protein